mmetsp:Transcript_127121/g.189573  ORF Transcript_127121/g.189573 Transcript_127121/m.189573 type:complete len:154 (+) Transcript_127121:49-510(+)
MACPQIPWQIIIIVLSIILILCSSLFWYYLYLSVEPCCSIAGIILYIISGLCLVIFGIIGIIVAIRKTERGLLFFGGAMGIMFGFQMVQIIIATVALANCDRDSLLTALCETNQFLYYIHVFIVLIVCLLLCIFSFILRKILISSHEDEDNYY